MTDRVRPRSHALLADEVRRHYLDYYRRVFRDGALDLRTKELIALGASLATGAPNCVEGHLTKLREMGVPEDEIREAVAVALGVAGASVVDRGDIAQAAWEAARRLSREPAGTRRSKRPQGRRR